MSRNTRIDAKVHKAALARIFKPNNENFTVDEEAVKSFNAKTYIDTLRELAKIPETTEIKEGSAKQALKKAVTILQLGRSTFNVEKLAEAGIEVETDQEQLSGLQIGSLMKWSETEMEKQLNTAQVELAIVNKAYEKMPTTFGGGTTNPRIVIGKL